MYLGLLEGLDDVNHDVHLRGIITGWHIFVMTHNWNGSVLLHKHKDSA